MGEPRVKIDIPGGTGELVAPALGGAGKGETLVSRNTSGVIDISNLPAGIGADTFTGSATEALASGDYVQLYSNAGAPAIRKADASVSQGGKAADGFVLSAFANGAAVTGYRSGPNTSKTGLSVGLTYYLDPAVPGGVTTTYPATSGQTRQIVGKAFSATVLATAIQPFTAIA